MISNLFTLQPLPCLHDPTFIRLNYTPIWVMCGARRRKIIFTLTSLKIIKELKQRNAIKQLKAKNCSFEKLICHWPFRNNHGEIEFSQ